MRRCARHRPPCLVRRRTRRPHRDRLSILPAGSRQNELGTNPYAVNSTSTVARAHPSDRCGALVSPCTPLRTVDTDRTAKLLQVVQGANLSSRATGPAGDGLHRWGRPASRVLTDNLSALVPCVAVTPILPGLALRPHYRAPAHLRFTLVSSLRVSLARRGYPP